MNEIRRSRRLRLPRRRYQLNKPLTSDDDDDDEQSDYEYEQFQHRSIARGNQNANRTATISFNPISKLTIQDKHQSLPIISDPSSLFLYSIRSGHKPTVSHSDLTALTRTPTNTTSLTALPCSDSKMTDTGVVKIDLTDLSETETLDSSPTTSGHDRKISQTDTDPHKDRTPIDETDLSVKSIIFSKDHSFDQERAYPQHNSCIIIPSIANKDRIIQTKEIHYQQSCTRWTNTMKYLIGCTTLCLIAGILMLVLIL